jgi:branched-chain amino acid transport system permease protein
MDITILVAQLVNGLAVGSIYALGVTGFNLLFLVCGVIQFAYLHIVVLSMYMTWLVIRTTDGNLFLAIPAALVASIIMNIATEPIFRPMIKRAAMNQALIVAIAIGTILTHIMAKHLNYGMPVSFPESLASQTAAIQFGVAALSWGQLLTLFGSIIAVILFMYFVYGTMTGRAFRTMAQSPFAARLLGIPIVRTAILSYGVAGLLGGVTAVFLSMALGTAHPALGDSLAIKVMATALFAGMGNLKGGLICGLILGLAESLTTGYFQGQWANAVSFGMIMIVVMFRPHGLFGEKV